MGLSCRLLAMSLTTIAALAPQARGLRVMRSAAATARSGRSQAIYEDDPWLTSPERQPLSGESLDVLFKYGPVVYGSRCNAEEYNASVRNFMARYPKISRQLAEQEIHEYLSDSNGYLARTTAKTYRGPREEDLCPPVGLVDKLLVVAWVAILVPASVVLTNLAITTPVTAPYGYIGMD